MGVAMVLTAPPEEVSWEEDRVFKMILIIFGLNFVLVNATGRDQISIVRSCVPFGLKCFVAASHAILTSKLYMIMLIGNLLRALMMSSIEVH